MEAVFALDERSALSLYDCLVPMLKEHRRFKINLHDAFNINDFKTQQRVKTLEWELSRSRLPGLIEENGTLIAKVKQLNNELEIVNWYCKFAEDGIDTKKLAQNYYELTQENDKLKQTTTTKIKKLEAENADLTQKLKAAMKQLKRQQESVVEPLIEEVTKREVESQKLYKELKERTKNLKILFAMI